MGYTLYWTRKAKFPARKFKAAAEACRLACERLAVPLSDARFSAQRVCFNGAGDDGHETFFMPLADEGTAEKGKVFGFCKTERKPYDICVAACLVIFERHLGTKAIAISSDDGEEGFAKARQFVAQLIPEDGLKRVTARVPSVCAFACLRGFPYWDMHGGKVKGDILLHRFLGKSAEGPDRSRELFAGIEPMTGEVVYEEPSAVAGTRA